MTECVVHQSVTWKAGPTLYPHLSPLIKALEQTGLPVTAFASMESIVHQSAPALYLLPEDIEIKESIGDGRTITAIRISQQWLILIVLSDAGDQFSGSESLEQLGEWQARIVKILAQRVLSKGGPIQVLDIPKPMVYAGGMITGQIRIGSQFVLSME